MLANPTNMSQLTDAVFGSGDVNYAYYALGSSDVVDFDRLHLTTGCTWSHVQEDINVAPTKLLGKLFGCPGYGLELTGPIKTPFDLETGYTTARLLRIMSINNDRRVQAAVYLDRKLACVAPEHRELVERLGFRFEDGTGKTTGVVAVSSEGPYLADAKYLQQPVKE